MLGMLGSFSCSRQETNHWQGYFEGEFVYIAAPLSGQLNVLNVARGDHVETGTLLFSLEHAAETAAQSEAENRLAAVRARLADMRLGSRPSELATLQARIDQANATAKLSGLELTRQEKLHAAQVNSAENYDRARLTHERNLGLLDELNAQMQTAQLGARVDAIAAVDAEVQAAEAAKARTDWNVSQKSQHATHGGVVYDTLYRPGEYVIAGKPVVALLPPENIKLRFFVSEKVVGTLKIGHPLLVQVDGRENPIKAHINYISPKPEYTPPILYNRENREKLTFMVEAAFASADARDLHPGQPVSVTPAE